MKISNFPESPGIYIFKDIKRLPIYIGKAKNLKNRISSYFAINLLDKTRRMLREAIKITVIEVQSEFEAIILEALLVNKFKPKYNFQLKDDKSPLYVGITKDEYPRILTLRKRDLSKYSLDSYFGPFIEAGKLRTILRSIRRIYGFSTHLPGKKACLESQIGLCCPCPSDVMMSKKKNDYLKNIQNVKKILSGQKDILLRQLFRQIHKLSSKELYEEAIEIKKQISMLENLQKNFTSPEEYLKNPNLIEDLRKIELDDLSLILDLKKNAQRIECFDVAHLSGSFPTASLITFINGKPDKSLYRRFFIKGIAKGDDPGAIRSVITRRLKHLEDWGSPDLIIVDGGRGQVSRARQVVKDIPIAGLAKGSNSLYFFKSEKFVSVSLSGRPSLNLLERVRDEAHRFARSYHHKLISKTIRETFK